MVTRNDKIKISSSDTTSDYLENKIEAGDNITITKTSTLGVETLTISADDQVTSSTELQEKIKVSSDDTISQYLENKIIAGDNVTITKRSILGVEYLEFKAYDLLNAESISDLEGEVADLKDVDASLSNNIDEHYIQHSDAIDTIRKDLDGYVINYGTQYGEEIAIYYDNGLIGGDSGLIWTGDTLETENIYLTEDATILGKAVVGEDISVGGNIINADLSETFNVIRKDMDGYALESIEEQRWIDSSEQLQDIRDSLDGYVLTDGSEEITQPSWIAVYGGVGFDGSWVNFSNTETTFYTAKYFKDSLGIVHLQGMVKDGALGTSIFTLPAGYRPSKQIIFPVVANNSAGRVTVEPDGSVVAHTIFCDNTWISLNGISFRAD